MANTFMGQKKQRRLSGFLVPVASFAVVLGLAMYGFFSTQGAAKDRAADAAREAIRRWAVSCYATEGFYPPSLSYLREHYGVVVDEQRFVVYYESVGDNIFPSIMVRPMGQEVDGGE